MIIKRSVSEHEVLLTAAAMNQLASGVDRILPNIGTRNGCNMGLCIAGNGECYWTIRLKKLPLRSPYGMRSGVMVPTFTSKSDPVHDLSWVCPEDMWLFVILLVKSESVVVGGNYRCDKAWMVALDRDKIQWQLPLGNLYDDCGICTGQRYGFTGFTQLATIDKMMEQIEKSEWNSDLPKPEARVHGLFRFKPKNNGFEQLMPEGSGWRAHCVKVSIPVWSRIAQTELV